MDPEYNFIGTRIFNELKKLGYTGSIGPIYRFLKTLNEEKREISRKATIRFETPLGEQAQFDWSPYKMVIDNEIKEVYCYTMILIESLDKILGYCIKNSIFEIDDIKGVLKEKYIEIALGEIVDPIAYSNKTTHSLARDLSYYEGGAEIE